MVAHRPAALQQRRRRTLPAAVAPAQRPAVALGLRSAGSRFRGQGGSPGIKGEMGRVAPAPYRALARRCSGFPPTREGRRRAKRRARATGQEVEQLRGLVAEMRPKLESVSRAQFEEFVARLRGGDGDEGVSSRSDQARSANGAAIAPESAPLMSYHEFLTYLRSGRSQLAKEVRIATNQDGNNNTGKVKQAFFGAQRFLQEHPQHRSTVAALSIREWFDITQSSMAADWLRFYALAARLRGNDEYGAQGGVGGKGLRARSGAAYGSTGSSRGRSHPTTS